MTDSNNSNPVDAARSAVIDSMVAAGATDAHVQITEGESLQYNAQTGELTGNAVSHRIPETGRNISEETAKVHARVNALNAQLAEKSYDPATGKETGFKVSDPTKRGELTAQFGRALEAAQLDLLSLAKLEAQREQDRISAEAASNEKLALQAFSNGDQTRAKAMSEAMLRAEADEAARAIIEGRRVAAKYGAR
jgi:hypothetical protein